MTLFINVQTCCMFAAHGWSVQVHARPCRRKVSWVASLRKLSRQIIEQQIGLLACGREEYWQGGEFDKESYLDGRQCAKQGYQLILWPLFKPCVLRERCLFLFWSWPVACLYMSYIRWLELRLIQGVVGILTKPSFSRLPAILYITDPIIITVNDTGCCEE